MLNWEDLTETKFKDAIESLLNDEEWVWQFVLIVSDFLTLFYLMTVIITIVSIWFLSTGALLYIRHIYFDQLLHYESTYNFLQFSQETSCIQKLRKGVERQTQRATVWRGVVGPLHHTNGRGEAPALWGVRPLVVSQQDGSSCGRSARWRLVVSPQDIISRGESAR